MRERRCSADASGDAHFVRRLYAHAERRFASHENGELRVLDRKAKALIYDLRYLLKRCADPEGAESLLRQTYAVIARDIIADEAARRTSRDIR